MRLLNAYTLLPKWFADRSKTPHYAILSHTWGDEEISYEDMMSRPLDQRRGEKSEGIFKITKCAEQALEHGLQYIWVDTCCIQKTSSAELSEAINSMYRWYKESAVCFAYLADLPEDTPRHTIDDETLRPLRWFSRGWTLQELIAPSVLVFFKNGWYSIGSKQRYADEISRITGIPPIVLKKGDAWGFSVAQKMSWVGKRRTTRLEDEAYCLLGIFDIHMPLLYGEGAQAFQRLQEEIVKMTDDETIFAWKSKLSTYYTWRTLFAHCPAEFAESRNFIQSRHDLEEPVERIGTGSIRLKLRLIDRSNNISGEEARSHPAQRENLISWPKGSEFIAYLQCVDSTLIGESHIGIFVRRLNRNQFVRVDSDQLCALSSRTSSTEQEMSVTVKQRLDHSPWYLVRPGFRISALEVTIMRPPPHLELRRARFNYLDIMIQFDTDHLLALDELALLNGEKQLLQIEFKVTGPTQKRGILSLSYDPVNKSDQTMHVDYKEAVEQFQSATISYFTAVRVSQDYMAILLVFVRFHKAHWKRPF